MNNSQKEFLAKLYKLFDDYSVDTVYIAENAIEGKEIVLLSGNCEFSFTSYRDGTFFDVKNVEKTERYSPYLPKDKEF